MSDTDIFEPTESTFDRFTPYAGIPTWCEYPHSQQAKYIKKADIVAVGVPFDMGASNRPGARFAPRAMRDNSKYAIEYNTVYPWDYDIQNECKMIDYGDLSGFCGSGATERMLERTSSHADRIYKLGAFTLALGGDHTIPYGFVRAASAKYGKLAILHFDSHQDSADSETIGVVCHGTFSSDLAREGRVDTGKSVQVFQRTLAPNEHGYHIIDAFKAIEMGPVKLAKAIKKVTGDTPVYITFDIDAFDGAVAPATGTPVPGGPDAYFVRRLLFELDGLNVVGADIVEVAPNYDGPAQPTVNLATFVALDLMYLMYNTRKRMGINI